jgi:hypothetical protein
MWYKWFYKAPLFLLLSGVLIILFGFIVMLLWNALVPMLFHGPVLTFWQATGLLILVKILFHTHQFNRWSAHGWYPSHYKIWKNRFEARLAAMNPEEREKFKEEWRKRCNPRYWNNCFSPDNKQQPGDEKE